MFGQQDDSANAVASDMSQPAPGGVAPMSVAAPAQPGDDPNNFITPQPAAPVADDQPAAPVASDMAVVQPTAPAVSEPAVSADDDDLMHIKQQALGQLSPLVGHLDQDPEDKFRTLMMMIQASDNASLIKDAYAAAQQIEDEKTRAQALLDVVNEVNYFTQQHDNQETE